MDQFHNVSSMDHHRESKTFLDQNSVIIFQECVTFLFQKKKLNARTIFVDFRDIPLPRPGNRASLTDSLYLAILNSAIGETKTLEDYYQIFSSCPNPKLLADFLAEKTGHQGKWFVAFDEIGFIDDRNYDIFFESGSQKEEENTNCTSESLTY